VTAYFDQGHTIDDLKAMARILGTLQATVMVYHMTGKVMLVFHEGNKNAVVQ